MISRHSTRLTLRAVSLCTGDRQHGTHQMAPKSRSKRARPLQSFANDSHQYSNRAERSTGSDVVVPATSTDDSEHENLVVSLPAEIWLTIMDYLHESGHQRSLLHLISSAKALYLLGAKVLYEFVHLPSPRLAKRAFYDKLESGKWTGAKQLALGLVDGSTVNYKLGIDCVRAALPNLTRLSLDTMTEVSELPDNRAKRSERDLLNLITSAPNLTYLNLNTNALSFTNLATWALPSTLTEFHLNFSNDADPEWYLAEAIQDFLIMLDEVPNEKLDIYFSGLLDLTLIPTFRFSLNLCRRLKRMTVTEQHRDDLIRLAIESPHRPLLEVLETRHMELIADDQLLELFPEIRCIEIAVPVGLDPDTYLRHWLPPTVRELQRVVLIDPGFPLPSRWVAAEDLATATPETGEIVEEYVENTRLEILAWRARMSNIREIVLVVGDKGTRNRTCCIVGLWTKVPGVKLVSLESWQEGDRKWWPVD